MTRLYRFIFDNSRWWWGKLAASTLIGALVGAKAASHAKEAAVADNWRTFGVGGAIVGFVAAFTLMINDYRRGVAVDDATRTSTLAKPRWSKGATIAMVVGVILLIFVANMVWVIWGLMR